MDGKGQGKQRGKQLKRRRGCAGGKVRKKRKILALKQLFNRRRCLLATQFQGSSVYQAYAEKLFLIIQ